MIFLSFVVFLPPSTKIGIWLERCGRDFEPVEVQTVSKLGLLLRRQGTEAAEKVLIFDFIKTNSKNIAICYIKVEDFTLKSLDFALKMGN